MNSAPINCEYLCTLSTVWSLVHTLCLQPQSCSLVSETCSEKPQNVQHWGNRGALEERDNAAIQQCVESTRLLGKGHTKTDHTKEEGVAWRKLRWMSLCCCCILLTSVQFTEIYYWIQVTSINLFSCPPWKECFKEKQTKQIFIIVHTLYMMYFVVLLWEYCKWFLKCGWWLMSAVYVA